MNEQVFTITTSASSASGMTRIPALWRWPTIISLSTRFLAQPSEMRLTVIMPALGQGCERLGPRPISSLPRLLLPSCVSGKRRGACV